MIITTEALPPQTNAQRLAAWVDRYFSPERPYRNNIPWPWLVNKPTPENGVVVRQLKLVKSDVA